MSRGLASTLAAFAICLCILATFGSCTPESGHVAVTVAKNACDGGTLNTAEVERVAASSPPSEQEVAQAAFIWALAITIRAGVEVDDALLADPDAPTLVTSRYARDIFVTDCQAANGVASVRQEMISSEDDFRCSESCWPSSKLFKKTTSRLVDIALDEVVAADVAGAAKDLLNSISRVRKLHKAWKLSDALVGAYEAEDSRQYTEELVGVVKATASIFKGISPIARGVAFVATGYQITRELTGVFALVVTCDAWKKEQRCDLADAGTDARDARAVSDALADAADEATTCGSNESPCGSITAGLCCDDLTEVCCATAAPVCCPKSWACNPGAGGCQPPSDGSVDASIDGGAANACSPACASGEVCAQGHCVPGGTYDSTYYFNKYGFVEGCGLYFNEHACSDDTGAYCSSSGAFPGWATHFTLKVTAYDVTGQQHQTPFVVNNLVWAGTKFTGTIGGTAFCDTAVEGVVSATEVTGKYDACPNECGPIYFKAKRTVVP